MNIAWSCVLDPFQKTLLYLLDQLHTIFSHRRRASDMKSGTFHLGSGDIFGITLIQPIRSPTAFESLIREFIEPLDVFSAFSLHTWLTIRMF